MSIDTLINKSRTVLKSTTSIASPQNTQMQTTTGERSNSQKYPSPTRSHSSHATDMRRRRVREGGFLCRWDRF